MTTSAHPFTFNTAIVRDPAPSVVNGLRDGAGDDPDYDGVEAECQAYRKALTDAGVKLIELPALEAFPDSLFVEDPALVFAAGAIELRPGAPSRYGEAAVLRPTLEALFERVLRVERGFADGGDMLYTPQGVLIGLSGRTDKQGAESVLACLSRLGLTGRVVHTPPGVLHFKSDCSLLDESRVISTQRLAASNVFQDFDVVTVPDGEEAAANALRVNDHVLIGSAYPKTIEKLEGLGYTVVPLPTTEIAKIDAGLSCLSLRWQRPTVE